MLPKVSVAIITYNQKQYLYECIESVLSQDYPNLEIVVADDCSTDGTQDMLKSYQAKYPSLFKLILSEKNEGITSNSNKAFFACSGKYIAWMGGDDLMLPGKLIKQVMYLEERPLHVLCYHDLEVFDSNTGKILRYYNSGRGRIRPREGSGYKLIRYADFMGASSVMTRRLACPKDGFDLRLPIASDWLFWIETAINGYIGYIPEVLGRYRIHQNNISIHRSGDCFEEMLTLAIIESKYPHLVKHCRPARARILYSFAVNKILENQGNLGRQLLVESLKYGWVSWKWIGWLLISYKKDL